MSPAKWDSIEILQALIRNANHAIIHALNARDQIHGYVKHVQLGIISMDLKELILELVMLTEYVLIINLEILMITARNAMMHVRSAQLLQQTVQCVPMNLY